MLYITQNATKLYPKNMKVQIGQNVIKKRPAYIFGSKNKVKLVCCGAHKPFFYIN